MSAQEDSDNYTTQWLDTPGYTQYDTIPYKDQGFLTKKLD